jgi:hypothetical protein
LALTRRVLDLTKFQMARLLGTDMSTWGTYEAGLERIPPYRRQTRRLNVEPRC